MITRDLTCKRLQLFWCDFNLLSQFYNLLNPYNFVQNFSVGVGTPRLHSTRRPPTHERSPRLSLTSVTRGLLPRLERPENPADIPAVGI